MTALIAWYWIAAAADAWTTERALDRVRQLGFGAKEKNPLARFLIEKLGDRAYFVTKTAGFLLLLWLGSRPLWIALIILQLLLALWNLRILLRLKRRVERSRLPQ